MNLFAVLRLCCPCAAAASILGALLLAGPVVWGPPPGAMIRSTAGVSSAATAQGSQAEGLAQNSNRRVDEPPLRLEEVDQIISDMAAYRGGFDARKLHSLGRPGLVAVLNWLLPDTAPTSDSSAPVNVIRDLIIQLGDERFPVREEATSRLIVVGRNFPEQVAQATRSNDPEVRRRASLILQTWRSHPVYRSEKSTQGFAVYVEGIKDKERVDVLAERAITALRNGPPKGVRASIVHTCLRAVVRSGDPRYCEALMPLLKHEDVAVGAYLIKHVAVSLCHETSFRPQTFYRPLLLEALESPREPIVDAAISVSPHNRAPEVKRLLRRVFETGSEPLKFHACFPLMFDYDDQDAFRYLLEQTQSQNRARAILAIAWVGDACNSSKPVPREVLDKLVPFLRSDDDELRGWAAHALGTYSGEEVVKNLIPMLADKRPGIVEATGNQILFQLDKTMLRRVLSEAARNHENDLVRNRARGLLQRLSERQ